MPLQQVTFIEDHYYTHQFVQKPFLAPGTMMKEDQDTPCPSGTPQPGERQGLETPVRVQHHTPRGKRIQGIQSGVSEDSHRHGDPGGLQAKALSVCRGEKQCGMLEAELSPQVDWERRQEMNCKARKEMGSRLNSSSLLST